MQISVLNRRQNMLDLDGRIGYTSGAKQGVFYMGMVVNLIRHCETTEEIEIFLKSKTIETMIFYDPRLREADHGRLSGLAEKEYRQLDCFKHYKTLTPEEQFSAAMDPEYGENYRLVAQRTLEAILHYRSKFPGDEIYFVTHGGPMRAIYTHLTGNSAPFSNEYDSTHQLKNCCVMTIDHIEDAEIPSSKVEFRFQ